jgi:hypothetical protein
MYRTLVTILAACILLPCAARAQSVDDIIAKNIEAHGGMEKLKSVQTLRASGNLRQAISALDSRRRTSGRTKCGKKRSSRG